MERWRRARGWCMAKGRCQFVLTVAMVTLLTGLCCALAMAPKWALPKIRAAQHVSTENLGQAPADDPRLAAVRRTLEPFGPIETLRVPGGDGTESLVVGHPGHRAELEVLARELPAATAAITELWGPDWAQSALVVVAANPSEFAALVRAGAEMPREVAAASVADPFVRGSQPTGQRVVFSPDAGRRLTPDGLRTLLRHELTHIAARAATVDGAPQWMLEGFAEYAAHRGEGHAFADIAPTVDAALRAGSLPADLPRDTAFTGGAAVAAYEEAWTVSAFVAEKYDEHRLVELYRRIAADRLDAAGEDRVLREVLGVGRADFVADWRAWLSAQAM
ncbi:hypothetical protein ACFYT3_13300 [Nocardia amikacinitolerans]|uniref:hypothetical protein n=1 Tax=Nocardia amikacinitolerans TaxID=756689 RepID=UPI0036AF1EF3